MSIKLTDLNSCTLDFIGFDISVKRLSELNAGIDSTNETTKKELKGRQ